MSDASGHLFVLSAPSGTGKTTLCREVVKRVPGVVLSISHTTRPPRPGEQDGREYHFVSREAFRGLLDENAFLEYAEYNGNLYGTSWRSILGPIEAGLDVLLEIETEGARQVRERRPDAHLIFLLPPSLDVLAARLRGRGTDDETGVAQRLAIARRELRAAPLFDAFVVNDELEHAAQSVVAFVAAARAGTLASQAARFGLAAARAQVDAALASWLE